MNPAFELSYYPWITQHVPATDVRRAIEEFAKMVGEELSKDVKDAALSVLDPVEVPVQIRLVCSRPRHIALMNPLGYVFARQTSQAVEAIAVALRLIDGKVGNTYFAQLYTHVKTAITDLKKSRGRSIAFGVPYSTSNFLVPALMLQQAGLHPLVSFTRLEFLGGHDTVAQAVYDGRVDLGAGHDGVIHDLAGQYGHGDAEQRLKTLSRSKPIPSDPVVVHAPDASERKAVQKALVSASQRPDGKAAIARFWGNAQGLAVTDAGAYDVLLEAVKILHLSQEDLLPRS